MSRRSLALLAALAAMLLSAVAAVPASAGVLVASAPDCDNGPTAQPFRPWLDPAQYFLAPGGGFENGAAGWSLDGASVGAGNQSFGSGSAVLALPSGASATSPVFCVGIEHPTARFFVRRTGGSALLSSVRVEARFELATGTVVTLPVGLVSAGSSWQPSPVTLLVGNLLALLPGEHTPAQLRFTAQGGGSFEIDDVYVDPYGRG